jgi:HTH-type transcriptional regulator, sugar sensing transcriptional regulator
VNLLLVGLPRERQGTHDERVIGEPCLVIDDKKAIILDSEDGVPNSVISSHYSMVKTIRNYIKNDIFVNRTHYDLKDEFYAYYGENLERLYGSDN